MWLTEELGNIDQYILLQGCQLRVILPQISDIIVQPVHFKKNHAVQDSPLYGKLLVFGKINAAGSA